MTFELEYDVEVRGDAVNVVRASIEMPAFAEDWDNNDPEDPAVIKRLAENLEKAKKAANAVFGTNFEFDAVHWNGSGDYKLNQNYEHELYGRKVQMSFEFMTKTMDSIGRNRASFKISIRSFGRIKTQDERSRKETRLHNVQRDDRAERSKA